MLLRLAWRYGARQARGCIVARSRSIARLSSSSTASGPLAPAAIRARMLLLGDEIDEPGAAHRLHVDEDVGVIAVADEETIALEPIEPFDPHRLRARPPSSSSGIGSTCVAARRAAVSRSGPVAVERSKLTSARACSPRSRCTARHIGARALGQAAAAERAQHREMDQDIALAIVADQEAEAAGRIEPLDRARDFNLAGLRERRRFRVCIVGTDYSGAARTVRIRLVMKGSKMRRLETGWSMIGRAHRTQRHASATPPHRHFRTRESLPACVQVPLTDLSMIIARIDGNSSSFAGIVSYFVLVWDDPRARMR